MGPALVLSLVLSLALSPALAEFRYDLGDGAEVEFYGQVNPAYAAVDDGTQTYRVFADSATSSSRIGLRMTHPGDRLSHGFRFETALGLPLTSEYDQNGASRVRGWRRRDIRHVDLWVTGRWGQLSYGQGSMAADGIAQNAASAVSAVLYQFTADANGLYRFRTGSGALSLVAVGSVFADFDGGRRVRLRYDTPGWRGFVLSVAHGQNLLTDPPQDDWYSDIALRYHRTLGNGTEVTAGLAYQLRERTGAESTSSVIASATAMLPSGVSVSAGYGQQQDQRPGFSDPGWVYGQIAYDRRIWRHGVTSVGLDLYRGHGFLTDGSDSTAWGVGLLQKIDPLRAEAYVTYRVHAYDTPVVTYRDMSTWLIGMRIRF